MSIALGARRASRVAPNPTLVAAGLAVLGLATATTAHEGDRKVREKQPAYAGSGWISGATRNPSGPITALGSPVPFESSGVQLLSWLTLDDFGTGATTGNDCWGYTTPSGRKYALMGISNATCFVEITDPTNPVIVDIFSGPDSWWRDIKVYGTHAYAVSEGGGGIQVFDMAAIDSGVVTQLASVTSGPGTSASHNVAIDTDSGFLYRCGGGDEGLRIYSLANPAAPSYVAEWTDRYVHDAQIVTYDSGPYAGRQIAYVCGGFNGGFTDTSMDVLDVTNKSNIQVLQRVFWPGAAYSHQCWLSDDGQYLYVNDELDENGSINTKTIVIDVSDPANAFYVTSFFSDNTAVGHNLYVRDGLLYEANYRSGLRIYDVAANPTNPPEVAFFDTVPEDDAPLTSSLWSNYPYFDDGIVIGSDFERGLFVWYVGDPKVDFQFPGGAAPVAIDPAGQTIQVELVEANTGDLDAASAQLFYDAGNGLQSVLLTPLGGDLFEAALPPLPCAITVDYYFSALSTDGLVWTEPDLSGGAPFSAGVGLGDTVVASFNMQQQAGWVSGAAGDDATTGIWERANPIGTTAAPEDDNTPGNGGQAWITGQGSDGGSLGENDVDGGRTTLLSPMLDLSDRPGAQISYWRWYHNTATSAQDDTFEIDISPDGGSSWVPVERIDAASGQAAGGWIQNSFPVSEFILPTNQVRMRFVASDTGSASIVEAGIDDFEVVDLDCPDCDGNGLADGVEVLAGNADDIDGDFVPDVCVPLVGAPATLSVSAGGVHSWSLNAGASFAGDTYVVLGSASGTSPGAPLGSAVLPLNADSYTTFTLASVFLPPFVGTFGVLDGAGSASASLVLPAGTDPTVAGLVLNHAYPVLDATSGQVVFASNAVELTLVP